MHFINIFALNFFVIEKSLSKISRCFLKYTKTHVPHKTKFEKKKNEYFSNYKLMKLIISLFHKRFLHSFFSFRN